MTAARGRRLEALEREAYERLNRFRARRAGMAWRERAEALAREAALWRRWSRLSAAVTDYYRRRVA